MKLKFEKNVDWLKRNIPPDDIYMFAEQTFMSALFFLHKWNKCGNVQEEFENDEISRKWISNILGAQKCKDLDIDISLDLGLDSIEEE
jgi:hypothetical protein